MQYEIGKIVEFDGSVGQIVSEKGRYLFLKDDLEENVEVSIGKLVAFRGEKIQGMKRAFFVISAEKILEENAVKQYKKMDME